MKKYKLYLESKMYLTEALENLYHATYIDRLVKMLRANTIYMTFAGGTKSEVDLNKGKLYYLSTSRGKYSEYAAVSKKSEVSYPVILDLNGRAINANRKIFSIDYWGPEYRKAGGKDEAEDRIVSDDPKITPMKKYVNAIHIYLGDRYGNKNHLLEINKLANELNIPILFYPKGQETAFRMQRTERALTDINDVVKPDDQFPKEYKSRIYRVSDILDVVLDLVEDINPKEKAEWVQTNQDKIDKLYQQMFDVYKELEKEYTQSKEELIDKEYKDYVKKFKELVYDLKYSSDWRMKEIATKVGNELHNLKTRHEPIIHDVGKAMKKLRVKSIADLVNHLQDKVKGSK